MSYTGLVAEIPVGLEGLTGTKNLSQARPTQLLQALNVTFESGTLQKEGGSVKYNSSAISGAPSVLGGWDWWPTDGTQRMVIAASDGKLYKDSGDGTFPVTLKSGLTMTNVVPVFVEGGKEVAANNRKLFCFTGINAVQVLSADGATTTNLSAPPADWTGTSQPIAGAIHENALWGWGNINDPHRVYKSLTSNHEDFTTTPYSISVYSGDGDQIIAGISYKGALVLWKQPVGVFYIDTSSSDNTQWRAVKLSGTIGIASPKAMTIVDDDILFLDHSGNFQFISSTAEFGDLASRNLSSIADMNTFLRNNINMAQLALVKCIYYPTKREAHFAIAASGSTVNDRRIVVDFNRPELPRFRFSDKDVCQGLWLRQDSNMIHRPTAGDNTGFVWTLDQATRSKDGAAYTGLFQTAHDDFSRLDPKLATMVKYGDFIELVVEPTGSWDMIIDILWDGVITQTLNMNIGVTGAVLGSFVIGTDKLAADQVLNRKRRIAGGGRRFSMICRNAGVGEDFSVARAFLHFRTGDERLTA